MSDTTVGICGCCEEETDCIGNRCSDCSQPVHPLICPLNVSEPRDFNSAAGAALALGGFFLVLLLVMYVGQMSYTERALASCNAKIHANS